MKKIHGSYLISVKNLRETVSDQGMYIGNFKYNGRFDGLVNQANNPKA